MDFHVITPRGAELLLQLVEGRVILPPAPPSRQLDQFGNLPAAAPDPTAPGR